MAISDRIASFARSLVAPARGAAAQPRGAHAALGCSPPDLEHPWEQPFEQVTSELDVLYCFRLILGRLPSRPEWPGHRGLAGGNLTAVVTSYLSSKEFAARQLLEPQAMTEYAWVDLDGYGMYVPPHDSEVGRHIFGAKTYEPNVTAAVRRLVKPGMTFVDIGANIGYFALMAAHLVGEEGNVVAIEPNPSNVRFLYASALKSRLVNLRVLPFAACDSETLLAYNAMGTNGVVSEASVDADAFSASNLVYGVSLDTALHSLNRLDVMKIDVEGSEYRALKGAGEIIRQHRPVILSEFAPYALEAVSGVSGEAYLHFLMGQLGYHVSVIAATGDPIDFSDDDGAVMSYFGEQNTDHIDLIATP